MISYDQLVGRTIDPELCLPTINQNGLLTQKGVKLSSGTTK